MKKLLIMSIALVAIMATVFTVSAFAANTVEIGDVTIGKYYDAEGVYNDAYAVVTVPYTVTGDVDRLTFYLAAQDLSAALEGEEAKVIYIDETVNPEAASFTFVIEKARVKSALSVADDKAEDITYPELYALYDGETASPFVMTFKLGGTDVDEADSTQVVFTNPMLFGDVNNDTEISGKDSLLILRSVVKDVTLDSAQTVCAELNGDGEVTGKDSLLILRYVVKDVDYATFINGHYGLN